MEIRRVVTGHDEQGRAVVVSDTTTPNVYRPANRRGLTFHNIWQIDSSPAKVFGPEETTDCEIGLLPPKNGSVFRIIEFPPEENVERITRETARKAFAAIGAEECLDPNEDPPHPFMHRTETIDYALCVKGEICLVLDDSETLIQAGDTVIQRGTNHAWSNRSAETCIMMFVLTDGAFAD